jgi:uncharacterized protein YceH (UPF0502 family)
VPKACSASLRPGSSPAPATLSGMAQEPDLEARVVALETQVRDLVNRVRATAQDAAAARVLAGGADRDVADLVVKVDANRKAINALGEQTAARFDQLEQKVDNGFAQINRNFAQIDRNFAEVRGRLDATAAGQQQVVDLLTKLIEQQD